MARAQPDLDGSARGRRYRIKVGPHPHTAQSIHARKADFRQFEALLGQRQQMRAFRQRRRSHWLAMAGDLALLILATGGPQLCVEFLEVTGLRQGHPVIAPKVTYFTLHPAFFLWLLGRTKLAAEAPVRTESNESCGFFTAVAAQDLFYRGLEIVVAQSAENAAKIAEGVFVGLEERLLCGVSISPVKRRTTGHAAHRKDLQPDLLAA